MDVAQLALAAGAAGWRDAHDAIRQGSYVVAQSQLTDAEAALVAHAAERARAYANDRAPALGLTPREATVLWRVYFRAYTNGALDATARQSGMTFQW